MFSNKSIQPTRLLGKFARGEEVINEAGNLGFAGLRILLQATERFPQLVNDNSESNIQ